MLNNKNYLSKLTKKINTYNLDSFENNRSIGSYIKEFQIDKIIKKLPEDEIKSENNELYKTSSNNQFKPYDIKLNDLCRLHWITLSRKPVNILELGSGFSTSIFADALLILKKYYEKWANTNIRSDKKFHIYSIDESSYFLNLTKKRIKNKYSKFITFLYSSVDLIKYDNKFATVYNNLPNITPDLIYIDGPSVYATTKKINGFSIASANRMPMSSDVLSFEFFLKPGCIILVDGRTQNARFLKEYLKRNWKYMHNFEGDYHIFELQEEPLGKLNKSELIKLKNNEWLIS